MPIDWLMERIKTFAKLSCAMGLRVDDYAVGLDGCCPGVERVIAYHDEQRANCCFVLIKFKAEEQWLKINYPDWLGQV